MGTGASAVTMWVSSNKHVMNAMRGFVGLSWLNFEAGDGSGAVNPFWEDGVPLVVVAIGDSSEFLGYMIVRVFPQFRHAQAEVGGIYGSEADVVGSRDGEDGVETEQCFVMIARKLLFTVDAHEGSGERMKMG